jgi:hypothetical protein
MCNNPDLSGVGQRVVRLHELLDHARLTGLDFDDREHLHVVLLCLDMAIDHMEKLH